jgi:RimJ/RimL family protein N-acetyltransferase
MALTIVDVTPRSSESWREVHNLIIPTHPLSADDVQERLARNTLTLAYDGDVLVGNATIRPPDPGDGIATVIVRILPEHRRQGHGSEYLRAMLDRARESGAQGISTVVLTANTEGLHFAERHGFAETERYTVDGAEYVDLALP